MKTEPVLTAAAIAGVIVTLLNIIGVVVDLDVVTNIVAVILPLAAALLARAHVTPVAKPVPIAGD